MATAMRQVRSQDDTQNQEDKVRREERANPRLARKSAGSKMAEPGSTSHTRGWTTEAILEGAEVTSHKRQEDLRVGIRSRDSQRSCRSKRTVHVSLLLTWKDHRNPSDISNIERHKRTQQGRRLKGKGKHKRHQ
ncbi:hypothetical protein FKM82_008134 [Ascaphus truei]